MGEKVSQIAKVPEVKQSNSNFRVRRTKRLQSMDTPVDRILFLQRTAGNQAVSRLMRSGTLQAKLRIGQPGDKYEQEADRVADEVMRMPEPGVQRQVEPEEEEEETLQSKPLVNQIIPLVQVQRQEEPEEEEEETLQAKPLAGQITPLVQRQVEPEEEEEEMLQAKPLAEEITQLVQRQIEPEEEEEELQTKATSGHISEANPNLESDIQSLKGGGQPLSENDRVFFEPRFGHDFSHVRVHTGTQAAESVQEVNAKAFTVGQNVVFGAGEYEEGTRKGQSLMAHELTHVVQQDKKRRSLSGEKLSGEKLTEVRLYSHIPLIIQKANGSKSLTWTAWLLSSDGFEYNKLRSRLEEASYKFITHVKNEEGKWEKKFPTSKTPANQIGWSIGTPEGKWKWATTANVVVMCRTLVPSKLLKDFAAKFSDAVDLIRKSPDAMKLVIEAEKAGVKFGGYAKTGSVKIAWPYTYRKTVYIPKARTDKVIAMSDFLFELNNAIRRPKFAKLEKEAAKGAKGKLTAKQYAYKGVEIEVEGMLRMGEIWFKMKKTIGKGKKWNKYDNDFYISVYKAFKADKKSKDDIVKEVLKYGAPGGKTMEQYYIDQY